MTKEDRRRDVDATAVQGTADEVVEADAGHLELPRGEDTQAAHETQEVALREREDQVAELQNKLLYLQAEMDNFKKRTERRYREALDFANEPVLLDLLPVMDNLERALNHARETGPGGFDGLIEGLENVLEQSTQVLARHGVEPVLAEGERFDPSVHEAIMQVPAEESGLVSGVFEKGFKLKGRLLRPAKVAVTKVASSQSDG